VIATAQHRGLLDDVLGDLRISPDYDLNVMQPGQTPSEVAARVLSGLGPILSNARPDWLLVQGDTVTVAAAAFAAYLARIRVGHVEAGLRTFDKWKPFPEEICRRIAGVVADLHFSPTVKARQNLLNEGVPSERVIVTGNTVTDALLWVVAQQALNELPLTPALQGALGEAARGRRLLLVTAHRRESFGEPLRQICGALRTLADNDDPPIQIVYPVHPNPNVREVVVPLLSNHPHITLTAPLSYFELVRMLSHCALVLTDSGGIQEEAPSLGKPVLVLRDETERPEAVEAGAARLVGPHGKAIIAETLRLLRNRTEYEAMAATVNPFGDGHAAERIVAALRGEHLVEFSVVQSARN